MRLYGKVMKERLKNIRLVVSDIDGTLLTSDNTLHAATMDAVHAFSQEHACCFTLGTGRAFPLVKPLADMLGLCSPFIFSGGAIFDYARQGALPSPEITSEMIARILHVAEGWGLGLIAHTEDRMLCQMKDEDWDRIAAIEWIKGNRTDHALRVHNLLEEAARPVIRIDLFSEDKDLTPVYQDALKKIPEYHVIPMNRSIELTPPDVNKGGGLKKLAALIGVEPEQVMAIGDSMNDLGLLQEAGVGVAMGTAPDVLKAIADIIVPSSDEGGFADALEFLPYFS